MSVLRNTDGAVIPSAGFRFLALVGFTVAIPAEVLARYCWHANACTFETWESISLIAGYSWIMAVSTAFCAVLVWFVMERNDEMEGS